MQTNNENHLIVIADTFNKLIHPRNQKSFKYAQKKLRTLILKYLNSGNILDVGGGDGKHIEGFQNSIVSDICLKPLQLALQKQHKAVQSDAHFLPFKNKTISLVLLSHVLLHSPTPSAVLKEICRVLVFNGILVLVLPNAAGFFQIYKLLRYGQVKPMGNPPQGHSLQYHQYTVENTRQLLEKHNFTVLEMHGDVITVPWLWKWGKWFAFSSLLATKYPKISDSLFIIAQLKT